MMRSMNSKQRRAAAKAYVRMCKYIGITFKGETTDTPDRVVCALEEMAQNYGKTGAHLPFSFTTFQSAASDLITVKDIDFTSLCEHHHLPFFGHAFVGYLPDKKMAGLSKIPRLVDFYAKAPRTQEHLTALIADDLMLRLHAKAVIVRLTAVHTCVCGRGVNKQDCATTTTAVRGPQGMNVKDEILQEFDRKG